LGPAHIDDIFVGLEEKNKEAEQVGDGDAEEAV
jgi:hypothetical protein